MRVLGNVGRAVTRSAFNESFVIARSLTTLDSFSKKEPVLRQLSIHDLKGLTRPTSSNVIRRDFSAIPGSKSELSQHDIQSHLRAVTEHGYANFEFFRPYYLIHVANQSAEKHKNLSELYSKLDVVKAQAMCKHLGAYVSEEMCINGAEHVSREEWEKRFNALPEKEVDKIASGAIIQYLKSLLV
jgi:hypothetical protein